VSREPPYHLVKVIACDFFGPVGAPHHPEFAGWQPLRRQVDGPPKKE
jgi:hypothetical protein